jgi:hypothetical protein
MTRDEAKRWYLERCPGGEGHEYEGRGTRWMKGDCHACIIDALSAVPSSSPGEREEAVALLDAALSHVGPAWPHHGRMRAAVDRLVADLAAERLAAQEAVRKQDESAAKFQAQRDEARASLSRVRGETLAEVAVRIKETSFAERFLMAQWLRSLASSAPGDDADWPTCSRCGVVIACDGTGEHRLAVVEKAAQRIEAQIERLIAIGTPKPGVVEALREACVHVSAGDTKTLVARAPAEPARDDGGAGPMTWGVSTDEESFHGHYASKEEALENAVSDLGLEPGQRFWVGGGALYRPTRSVDADSLFDKLAEHAGDECGEIAEDWLSAVSREDSDALEGELHAVVLAWLARTGLMPQFYCCETTEEHHAPAPSSAKGSAHSDTCIGRVHDKLGCSCGSSAKGSDEGRGT